MDGDELPVTTFKCRSMCAGDVVVDESGRGYFCSFVGWAPVAILPSDGAPTKRSGS